jgi:acyl-homoserine lactone acylase PvdQ
VGGRAKALRESLHDAIEWLRKEFGDDISSWEWGRIHQQTFTHILSKQKPFNLSASVFFFKVQL